MRKPQIGLTEREPATAGWGYLLTPVATFVAHEVKGNTVLRNWSPDVGRYRRARMLGNRPKA